MPFTKIRSLLGWLWRWIPRPLKPSSRSQKPVLAKVQDSPDRRTPKRPIVIVDCLLLYELVKAPNSPDKKTPKCPRFVVDCLFLCELIERLTLTAREDVTYVSGIRVGDDRILTRIIPVDLDSASLGHANASAASCAEVMIRLVEADLPLVAMAHSHPGTSPESTRPSSVDLRYMETLEQTGAKVIGLIVNRGGYVRFFSSGLRFEILIQGNEFQPMKGHKHVYQLVQHEAPA